MDKSFYMSEAIKEAYKAYEKGETPIGAVIVRDGEVVATIAHNLTETLNDPTAHAEILAIRKASEHLGGWRLINCDLYVTMEPCIMCSGAIVQSKIKKLIIGTKHIKNLNIEKQREFKIDYFGTCNIEVTFDILKEECSSILQKLFKELRRRQ